MKFAAIIALISPLLLQADVAKVMAEENLEKRSALALVHAGEEIDAARQAYSEDKMHDFRRMVKEVGALAELSYKSLQDTGKRARKSPKWFKRAELKLRGVLRRVADLERDVAYEDRELVAGVHKQVRTIHDQLLHDIMTKK